MYTKTKVEPDVFYITSITICLIKLNFFYKIYIYSLQQREYLATKHSCKKNSTKSQHMTKYPVQ